MLFTHVLRKDCGKNDFCIFLSANVHVLRTLLPGFLLSVKAVFKLSKFFTSPSLPTFSLSTFLSHMCASIYMCVCVCVARVCIAVFVSALAVMGIYSAAGAALFLLSPRKIPGVGAVETS